MAHPLHILIIEKGNDYRLVVEALHHAGLNINPHGVTNTHSLKQSLKTNQWDLILSTHKLADCPPEATLKLIRESNLDIPFLLVTRSISKDRLTSLFSAGAHAHIDIDNLYLLPSIIQRELSEASERRKQSRNNRILYKSAYSYRMLLENAPIPHLLLSNSHITYLNQAAKKLLGFRDDVPFSDIKAEEILTNSPDQLTTSLQNNQQRTRQPIQTVFRCRDGQEIQVEAWSSKTYHLNRPSTQIIFHEVTKHTTEESQLKQATNIFQNTTEGVVVMDSSAEIIAVNPAFSKITGYPEKEVVGKKPRFLNSEKHTRAFYSELWETLKKENSWQGEIWNRRKNGEVYPEWLTITSVLDDKGTVSQYVAAFSDITTLKQSQSQLEHLAHHDPLRTCLTACCSKTVLNMPSHWQKGKTAILLSCFLIWTGSKTLMIVWVMLLAMICCRK